MKTLLSVLEIYFNVYAITACFFSYPEAMNIEIEGEPDPEVRSVSSKNEFGFLNYLHFYTHHMDILTTERCALAESMLRQQPQTVKGE